MQRMRGKGVMRYKKPKRKRARVKAADPGTGLPIQASTVGIDREFIISVCLQPRDIGCTEEYGNLGGETQHVARCTQHVARCT